MNRTSKTIEMPEVTALKSLIKDEGGLGRVAKNLIELHINYSRQLIHNYENGEQSICHFGSQEDQLFHLMQVIAVCSAGSEFPLFTDLVNSEEKAA